MEIYNSTEEFEETHPYHVDDISGKIRRFITERGLSRVTMWRNSEFLEFYFRLKLDSAKKIVAVLDEYDYSKFISSETLEKLRSIDNQLVEKYLAQFSSEKDKLKNIFQETANMPYSERNKIIINKFNLHDLFKDTKPDFLYSEANLIALLGEDDYKKVFGEDTVGIFSEAYTKDGEPIIVVKVSDMVDVDGEEIDMMQVYRDDQTDVCNKAADSRFDEEEKSELFNGDFPIKYQPYINGEKDPDVDDIRGDLMEELINRFDAILPYKIWYASNIFDLNINFSSIIQSFLNLDDPNHYSSKWLSLKKEAKNTLMHEFHHSVNRFLPVCENRDLVKAVQKEILENWLSRFADEVVAYSYASKIASLEFYLRWYNDDTEFKNEDKSARMNEQFVKQSRLFEEINERIIESDDPQLISALFSLEGVRTWKYLHQYLMKGGLPELGYFKEELSVIYQ